ncbi:AAA family ATPase [Kineococcus sp. GCM10028916]|uniref:AAA family ATPase n=1 Tax=Kineococcus sp. GCM10028916 TaxID=3273394 RepID=UPI00362D4D42
MTREAQPLVEKLTIKNYRVLKAVEFEKLSPLTVLLGPNGSGKSTTFDAIAFLHEAFTSGLRGAWDSRNRMAEIRSRGQSGPVSFEIKYREHKGAKLVTYHLEIDEIDSRPVVVAEKMRWVTAPAQGRPREILTFEHGQGTVYDEETATYTHERLESPELLAVSTLGQLSRHQRVSGLRRFIAGWYLSYLSADQTRTTPLAGPQDRLSPTGDNLPNVVQFLQERHPERLASILQALSRQVPHLEGISAGTLQDGRLLLRLKDAPFDDPILSRFTSDGTLKLFAYLTVLYDPTPASIVGIEEPENQLHPRLLPMLAEEARQAAERSQVLVTTHSPQFADALQPRELWIVHRAADGFTRVTRASDIPVVNSMMRAGAQLGDLWMENYFGVGDPLRAGAGV